MFYNFFPNLAIIIAIVESSLREPLDINEGKQLDGKTSVGDDSLDWRQKGVILPVYDQGVCGDSTLMTALDALSTRTAIVTGRPLTRLSLQQLYDCSRNPYWCQCVGTGTNVSDVYDFLINSNDGNVDSDSSYPLTGQCTRVCHFTKSGEASRIRLYNQSTSGNENDLHGLIQLGAVTVELNAGLESFQMYTTGIYDDPLCTADVFDHVMLVVGYGTESGRDFWIVKNSWGANWGESGYMRIARNRGNRCGIASHAAIPALVY